CFGVASDSLRRSVVVSLVLRFSAGLLLFCFSLRPRPWTSPIGRWAGRWPGREKLWREVSYPALKHGAGWCAWKHVWLKRWKSSPSTPSPACNRLLLPRREAAVGGGQQVND